MKKTRVGLVLGTGAARGWAHIGVLEGLLAADLVPDIICGTSMGALVGAAFAAGRFEALRDWAMAADRKAVASLVDVSLLSGGLVDGVRIVEWMAGLDLAGPIEDLTIPFAAVATDLETGREVWLRNGPLDQALRASISLPGIFSPVQVEGRWLVDGGLVNPVPVSLCRAMGADFVIAVNLNEDLLGRRLLPQVDPPAPSVTVEGNGNWIDMIKSMPSNLASQIASIRLFGSATTPGYFDVLGNSLNIMQDQITRSRLAGEPPHVMVLPHVIDIGIMDFHRARDAIVEGRAAVETAIPVIRAKLARQ